MARTKETEQKKIEDAIELSEMPLQTIEDYAEYNRAARRLRRPIKIPPSDLYKQVKVKFERFDQPDNVLKFYVRNAEIEMKGQLKPGCVYNLPLPVVKFLNKLATPIYAEVDVNDGSETKKETKQVGEKSRFSCQVVDIL